MVGVTNAHQERRQTGPQSEDEFRKVFETCPDAIFLADAESGVIVNVNRAACQLMAMPEEDILGLHQSQLHPPEEAERYRAIFQEHAQRAQAITQDIHIQRPSGERVPVDISASVVEVSGQQMVQGVFRDITDRRQAEESLRRRTEQLTALNEIGQAIGSILDLTQVLKLVAQKTAQICDVERCSILLLDEEKQKLLPMMSQFASGVADAELWRIFTEETYAEKVDDVHAMKKVIRERRTVVLERESLSGLPQRWTKPFGIKSLLLVPLVCKDETIGLMALDNTSEVRPFSAQVIDLATTIGSQIGIAIENAKLYQEEKRRVSAMEALRQTTLDITRQLDVPQLLRSIVEQAASLVGTKGGGLYLYHAEERELELVVSHYLDKDYTGTRLKVGEGLSGKAVLTGEALIVEDYPSWDGRSKKYEGAPFRGVMAVPLKWGERTLGVINVTDVEQPRKFTDRDLRLLELFANQAAIALENAHLYQQAQGRSVYLETLQRINATLRSTLPLSQVLETIVQGTTKALGYAGSLIVVPDDKMERLVLGAVWGSRFVDAALRLTGSRLESFSLPLDANENPIVRAFLAGELQTWSNAPERMLAGVEPGITSKVARTIERTLGARLGACVPLRVAEKTVGVLAIFSPQERLAEDERTMLLALANQAGLAVHNARLHEQTQRRVEELAALEEIVHELSLTLDFQKVIELLVDKAIEATCPSAGLIAITNQERTGTLLLAQQGYPAEVNAYRDQPWSIQDGIVGRVVKTGELAVVDDVTRDPDYAKLIPETRSQLTVPILRENVVAGAIVLESPELGGFNQEQARFVQHLAKHAAVAMDNAQLYEHQQRTSQELMALHETSLDITSRLELDGLLTAIVARAVALLAGRSGEVYLLHPTEGELIRATSHNLPPQLQGTTMKADEGLAGRILQTGEPLIVDDYDDWHGRSERYVGYGFGRVVGAPIRYGEELLGVLVIERQLEGPRFTKEDVTLLSLFANQAAIAIENARLYERLRESEERYRTYVENVPDAIWEADAEGRFIYWSPQIENLTGYPPEELLGHTAYEFLIHPDDADEFRSKAIQLFAEDKEEHALTHRALRRDGSVLYLETSMSPIRDDAGRVVRFQGVARDVSERVRLQAQLTQSAKLSAIGQMISGVAHELNNPLTTVMGYAQLLQASDTDESVKEDLQRIHDDALRAQRIVQNLLAFARQKKPQRTLVNINEVIERTLALRTYQLKVDNVQVVKELCHNLPPTTADDYQLQQVFLNIINNAHQAMVGEQDGGTLTIGSELLKDDIIRISFADTGPGIKAEILDKVFDPFFTTKEVGAGTGLGLSVSHGIVQEHGGRIWAESEPGQGATFVVELPVADWLDDVAPLSAADGTRPTSSESHRILVIDDEKSIVDLIVRVLKESGYRVDGVTDAGLALERLRQARYDLIISDIKMPGMDGPTCEKRIRAMDPALAQRIIFITGDLLSPTTGDFLEGWEGRRIKKPFDVEELKAVVLESLS